MGTGKGTPAPWLPPRAARARAPHPSPAPPHRDGPLTQVAHHGGSAAPTPALETRSSPAFTPGVQRAARQLARSAARATPAPDVRAASGAGSGARADLALAEARRAAARDAPEAGLEA